MKARFSTKCSVCDAFIEKGKEIVKNEDEELGTQTLCKRNIRNTVIW